MSALIDRLAREADEEFNPYDQTYVSMAREDVQAMIAWALEAFRAEAAKVVRAIGCTYPYNDLPGTCADNAGNHYGGCPIAVAAKIEAL